MPFIDLPMMIDASHSIDDHIQVVNQVTSNIRSTKIFASIGECLIVQARGANDDSSSVFYNLSITPRGTAANIWDYSNRAVLDDPDAAMVEYAEVKIVGHPEHGTIVGDFSIGSDTYYVPERGYVGRDKISFDVTIGSKVVRVVYFIKIVAKIPSGLDIKEVFRRYCPSPSPWRISTAPNGMAREFSLTVKRVGGI